MSHGAEYESIRVPVLTTSTARGRQKLRPGGGGMAENLLYYGDNLDVAMGCPSELRTLVVARKGMSLPPPIETSSR